MKLSDLFEASDSQIDKMLKTYFEFTGKYTINNNIVDVDGSCALRKKNIIFEKLPLASSNYNLKFGTINGDFSYPSNSTFSLEGGPEIVKKDFICSVNKLASLKGGPKIVNGDYLVHNNPLTSLEGCPNYVGGKITVPYIENLPMIRLLFIKGIDVIVVEWKNFDIRDTATQLSNILNKYKHTGYKGALQCAAELTKAGFKGNASL